MAQIPVALQPLLGAAIGALAAILYSYTGAPGPVLLWMCMPRLMGEPYVSGRNGRIIHVVTGLVELQLLRIAIAAHDPLVVCVVAQVVPRAAVVVLTWISRPAAEEPPPSITSMGALLAIAVGILAAFLGGWFSGTLILIESYVVVRLIRASMYRHRGVITRHSLAITRLAMELLVLLALSVPLPEGFRTFAGR